MIASCVSVSLSQHDITWGLVQVAYLALSLASLFYLYSFTHMQATELPDFTFKIVISTVFFHFSCPYFEPWCACSTTIKVSNEDMHRESLKRTGAHVQR